MYAQLSFFLLLLGLALSMVAYKYGIEQWHYLKLSWWTYSSTMLLVGMSAWMFIYGDDWRSALVMFIGCYGIFILVRREAMARWLGVLATLAPLLLVKTGVQPFFSILGLSFISFRAVDALLMQRPEDSVDPAEYFLYLFFPPAILAGPMYRWRNFREDIASAYERLSITSIVTGWEHLLIGIVQKFCFAQLIDIGVLQRVSADDYSPSGIAINALGYSAFLYFDFAGYSNMAIGAAALFGFRLPDNFRNPVLTTDPQDFWRRWHISLSEWLRDMVFTPLYKYLITRGGLAAHKLQAQNVCIMATLFIMGTWNGLEAKYVCSGLMFGVYSVIYNDLMFMSHSHDRLKSLVSSRSAQLGGRLLTLVLVVLALYVFSGRSPIR